jgi:hypothetical protein
MFKVGLDSIITLSQTLFIGEDIEHLLMNTTLT